MLHGNKKLVTSKLCDSRDTIKYIIRIHTAKTLKLQKKLSSKSVIKVNKLLLTRCVGISIDFPALLPCSFTMCRKAVKQPCRLSHLEWNIPDISTSQKDSNGHTSNYKQTPASCHAKIMNHIITLSNSFTCEAIILFRFQSQCHKLQHSTTGTVLLLQCRHNQQLTETIAHRLTIRMSHYTSECITLQHKSTQQTTYTVIIIIFRHSH